MGYDSGDSFPLNQMEFHMVQNRKETGHHDHIPFNWKGNGNVVFSVYGYLNAHLVQRPNTVNYRIQTKYR